MIEAMEHQAAVSLKICEVYPNFGNAYACDEGGRRFLVNQGSAGIEFEDIRVGQSILAHVNERNYVDRVERVWQQDN